MPDLGKSKSFQASLERSGNSLNWIIVRIPFDVAKTWGTRGQLRVHGDISGHEFHTSLFPNGSGGHYMIVNKQMQKGARAGLGERARFVLTPETRERKIAIPDELARELRQSKLLMRFFQSLNDSTRRAIADWVASGKQAQTRKRRIEQLAERLMETMEAEQELPPMIKLALNQNAQARAGWERMTPGQRRAHLLGIFYYRNPESRARRLAKAIEEMAQHAKARR